MLLPEISLRSRLSAFVSAFFTISSEYLENKNFITTFAKNIKYLSAMNKFLLFIVSAVTLLTVSSCHHEEFRIEDHIDMDHIPLGGRHQIWPPSDRVSPLYLSNISSILSPGNPASRYENYTISTVYDDKSEPCLYVLNFYEGGWAVVSATRKYKPVLAFSSTGSLDLNLELPEELEIWKETMVQTISNIDIAVPRDSIKLYQSEWDRISPQSVSSASTQSPDYSSDFTPIEYNRFK